MHVMADRGFDILYITMLYISVIVCAYIHHVCLFTKIVVVTIVYFTYCLFITISTHFTPITLCCRPFCTLRFVICYCFLIYILLLGLVFFQTLLKLGFYWRMGFYKRLGFYFSTL